MKILIVDDDKTSRKLLQSFLRNFGSIDITEDGAQALAAYENAWNEEHPYDLICLDIVMPKMDGHELIRAVRTDEVQRGLSHVNRVKVIMTTGMKDAQNHQMALEAGCDAYFLKPIAKRKISDKIHELGFSEEKKAEHGNAEE